MIDPYAPQFASGNKMQYKPHDINVQMIIRFRDGTNI